MWKNVPEIALFFVHNGEKVILKYNFGDWIFL